MKTAGVPAIRASRKPRADQRAAPVVKVPDFGFIAGKTDFRGLLKAPYVRFLIVNRDDPSKKIFFYIGSKGNQSVVPWGEETVVAPGYFILRLPPGAYKVTHIAIPVGSTIAEEGFGLNFDVVAGKAIYVGTLDVDGTQEKIKFGGVPLVRPGFAYRLEIRDEMVEAEGVLRTMLPPETAMVEKRLFRAGLVKEGEIPPTEVLRPGVHK